MFHSSQAYTENFQNQAKLADTFLISPDFSHDFDDQRIFLI